MLLKHQRDQAKKRFYLQHTADLTNRMITTIWCVLTSELYFANKNDAYDNVTAVAAVAKDSREARRSNTKDGGLSGFMRKLKADGLKVCADRKSLLLAEKHIEAMGIAIFEREGHGRVAIAHVNLRSAALFLELFHPPLEELQEIAGYRFNWLKAFLDKVLKRRFNRVDPEYGDVYDATYYQTDLAEYEAENPLVKFDFNKLQEMVVYAFNHFCRRIKRHWEQVVVYWDVDISSPPDEMEFA